MEERDKEPLVDVLKDLGGWPVLGDNEGGSWDEKGFDIESLLARLGQFNMGVIFSTGVGPDDKNSERYVLYVRFFIMCFR